MYYQNISKLITCYRRTKKFFLKFKPRPHPYITEGWYGILYYVDPASVLDNDIVTYGISQDWIAINLEHIIPKTGIIFDIGANVGLLTLPFSKISKHVYAFEPDTENFTNLQHNIKLNPAIKNITTSPLALTNNPSENKIKFYKRRAKDSDNRINTGLSSLQKLPRHNISTTLVPCSTIDLFMQKNIPQIDFIKIDVEGSEYDVLTGAIKTIEKFKPVILYECSNIIRNLLKSENTKQSFNLLQKLGYIQFQIVNESYLKKLDKYNPDTESDIIAFHKSTNYNKKIRLQMRDT